jgi:thymidylate synthase
MKQYHDLLRAIQEKGIIKSESRENMPYTQSLFGYQMRFDLSEGFPLLTTKKINFKHIVVELLWFLKGDTNIKYLVDNGVNIWNEDAYNYYNKFITRYCEQSGGEPPFNIVYEDIQESKLRPYTFEEFVDTLKLNCHDLLPSQGCQYVLGDCGKQYGWLWRNFGQHVTPPDSEGMSFGSTGVDQVEQLIKGLKSNPLGRRHIITAWNPLTLDDMALNACHAFVQFNCRPLSIEKRYEIWNSETAPNVINYAAPGEGSNNEKRADDANIPKYYLDCQLYQRSADVFLGVPYNITSYSLLTHIVAKLCNMIPGEFIHTFGDVHIYENHKEQVEEILKREPRELPKLKISNNGFWENIQKDFSVEYFQLMKVSDFELQNYNPHPPIKAKLSTGLK